MNNNKIKKAIMADNKKNNMEITSVKNYEEKLEISNLFLCVYLIFLKLIFTYRLLAVFRQKKIER